MEKTLSENKLKQNIKLLLANKDFMEDVFSFRKEWHIPISGYFNDELSRIWKKKLISNNKAVKKFEFDLQEILATHNISDYMKIMVEEIVVYRDINFREISPVGIVFKDGYKEKRRIFLEIYPETTTKDIQRIWTIVKSYSEYSIGYKGKARNKLMKNIDRDERINTLSSQKGKTSEIKKIIRDEFGVDIQPTDIPNIAKRFKKNIKTT